MGGFVVGTALEAGSMFANATLGHLIHVKFFATFTAWFDCPSFLHRDPLCPFSVISSSSALFVPFDMASLWMVWTPGGRVFVVPLEFVFCAPWYSQGVLAYFVIAIVAVFEFDFPPRSSAQATFGFGVEFVTFTHINFSWHVMRKVEPCMYSFACCC